jgi:hypothetical protein
MFWALTVTTRRGLSQSKKVMAFACLIEAIQALAY